MNTRYSLRAGAVAAAALCIIAIDPVALAGDVNPPAGAVAPTMKTLDEVEPRIPLNFTNTPGDLDSLYRITQPGSYYLTEDTSVRSSESGIEIDARDVTIDLMGYRLVGLTGSISGIRVINGSHITIRNGHITDFDSHGIDATSLLHGVIENVALSSNSGKGIQIGSTASILDCRAESNGDIGFQAGGNSVIRGSIAAYNGGDGVRAYAGVSDGCIAILNGGAGIRGSGSFSDCTSDENTSDGFAIEGNASLDGCRARNNSGNGFFLANEAISLVGCAAQGNTLFGFNTANSPSLTFLGCSAKGNGASGYNVGAGCTLEACSALQNDSHGIVGSAATTIRGCSARRNTGDGIRVISGSYVIGNVCEDNGFDTGSGAGIHATGADNRIEANSVTNNDRGIDVDSSVNVIVRNSAGNNTTNYDIAINNIVGPFVDASNVATDTSPHANYDY